MSAPELSEVPNLPLALDNDPGLVADPFGTMDGLRSQYRAFYTTAPPQPGWVLLQYEDIHAAFQHYEMFSSKGCLDPANGEPRVFPPLVPEELDPPEHTPYRQLLTPLFTPGKVAAMEPSIREHCVSLIDALQARGECDIVADFARRFPTIIFMRLMGLPVEDADTFLDWADELMHGNSENDPDMSKRMATAMQVFSYLGTLLEERQAAPRADIVSYLLAAKIDGRPLEQIELLQISFLLYMAGLDTVAGSLGYMFWHLAAHPLDRKRIIEDPAVIPTAVEELLRAYSIVTPVRVVTEDVEFAGCPMKAGDRVFIPTYSADRDQTEFDLGTDVTFDRATNRHLAFGSGPHRCLGSHLARLELQIALEEWHKRIPEYQIAEPEALQQHVQGVAGFDRLPLRWTT